jgi:hypothetical protein
MAGWGSFWGIGESGECRDVGALYGDFRRMSYKQKIYLLYHKNGRRTYA